MIHFHYYRPPHRFSLLFFCFLFLIQFGNFLFWYLHFTFHFFHPRAKVCCLSHREMFCSKWWCLSKIINLDRHMKREKRTRQTNGNYFVFSCFVLQVFTLVSQTFLFFLQEIWMICASERQKTILTIMLFSCFQQRANIFHVEVDVAEKLNRKPLEHPRERFHVKQIFMFILFCLKFMKQ